MLQRLKSLLTHDQPTSRIEGAKRFDLAAKPFTRALVLRAAEHQDEAIRDVREMGGLRTIPDEPSCDAFTASSASTIAYHITTEAAKSLGQNVAFLPSEPVPKEAPLVVAFALLVLAGVHGQLKSEGLQLPFAEIAAETANLFFLAHPDEERIENANRGIAAFRSFAQSDAANVRSWHDSLMKLVPMYISQWTTDNPELKKLDCIPLFGSMLQSLLKAAK